MRKTIYDIFEEGVYVHDELRYALIQLLLLISQCSLISRILEKKKFTRSRLRMANQRSVV